MRQHELVDAISLADPNAISNKEYRLWDNVVEVCKPLIEITLSGVVKFVHFTVKEYGCLTLFNYCYLRRIGTFSIVRRDLSLSSRMPNMIWLSLASLISVRASTLLTKG